VTASVRRPKRGGRCRLGPPLNPPLLTSEHVSRAEREHSSGKSGEQERSGEREAAEREQSGERVSQK